MEIHTILAQIKSLDETILSSELSPLELALVRSKIVQLYENTLGQTETPKKTAKQTITTTIEATEPLSIITESIAKITPTMEEIVPVIDPKVEETIEPAVADMVEEVKTAAISTTITTPEVEITHTETTVIKKEGSLLDSFASKDKSLMDSFATATKGLNDAVVEKDLKKLIDFNRQFVFIQELFGNDPKAYIEAINQLNAMSDLASAADFINQTIAPKYKWNRELQSIKLFEKIIRQKFGI